MKQAPLRHIGVALLAVSVVAAACGPWLAPHATNHDFPGLLNAPPTRLRIVDDTGGWRAPFIYGWTRVSQLEQRYEEDRTRRVPLRWFSGWKIVQSADEARAPLLVLGADSFGRDVFARLLFGARISLGLALLAAIGATLAGGLIGAVAGYVGGALDEGLMRGSEFVLVLPAMYVALALRSVMPLELPPRAVFLLLVSIFALVGAPFIARGVRGIVRSERRLEYAAAAASLGASHLRIVTRHLLPSARGFIGAQLTMLLPAFIVSEATLSYVGLGFPPDVPSWGTMLYDASNIRAIGDFPWLLSPAAAIFAVVLALNLTLQGRPEGLHYERPL